MKLEIQEYEAKRIVNKYKHVDGAWFWTRYSAHPYIGCRSGCEFCYLRGGIYLGRRDPDTFDTLIQVKLNAIELLRKELARLNPDVIGLGDWQQPVEDRYQLSRQMLKVLLEIPFPLFVVERSPLLLRDLDLLQDIHAFSNVCVAISMSNLDEELKRAFEPRSPGLKRRLQMLRTLADAGLQVGLSMMPIIPFLGDSDGHLRDLLQAGVDHGAQFVIASGMTMDGVQAERSLQAAKKVDPGSETRWRQLYNHKEGWNRPADGSPNYQIKLSRRVRSIAEEVGMLNRIPRWIPPTPYGTNKLLAEKLFIKMRDLELEEVHASRIWSFRKAAWTIDELEEPVEQLYNAHSLSGLEKLPDIDSSMARRIERWLKQHKLVKE